MRVVPAARESLDGNDAAPVVADDETSSPRVVASEAEQRAPGAGRGAGEVLLQRWLGARSRQEAQGALRIQPAKREERLKAADLGLDSQISR